MFLLLPMLMAADGAESYDVTTQITEWKAYAPGLAAPSVEAEINAKATMCAEKFGVTEFDALFFNLRFGPLENAVTLIEPKKQESRAVVRCIRDELIVPLKGQPQDTRGSVDLII
ncbi:MAG: hypothetical protein ACI9VR_003339, partial [Cognaticolwellia sp.]